MKATTPIKALIVTGGDWHPFTICSQILRETLEYGGLAKCTLAERDRGLEGDISDYRVVILYTQGGKLSKTAEQNLIAFVRRGGGLVGIHCASDSFIKNEGYLSLLGSKFVGHGPGTPTFPVEISNHEHPLTVRLPGFTITDEFYLLEAQGKSLEPFLTASWQGKTQPMAYTKKEGKGRIFYTALGHDERAFRNPGFKTLMVRGLLYAAGYWQKEGKPVGVGLLGYGGAFNMGKHHGQALLSAGGLVPVAACDLNPERITQAQADFPGIATYTSLKEMLNNKNVEVVVNILPHNLHYSATLQVLQSGRGAVVEKPFCLTNREADHLIEMAYKKKQVLTVYQNRRWDHHFRTAQKLVESGLIGTVFESQIDMGSYSYPGTWWRSDKNISGGILYDWGAHCLDWLLLLMADRVTSVSGYSQKRVWQMVTNEDHFRVIIRFAKGGVANFCNSSIYAAPAAGWRILGTQGAIFFPKIFDQEAVLTTINDGKPVTAQIPCEPDDWGAFYLNLADHLHQGVPLACRPEYSARVIGIINAAQDSAQLGREVAFEDKYGPTD